MIRVDCKIPLDGNIFSPNQGLIHREQSMLGMLLSQVIAKIDTCAEGTGCSWLYLGAPDDAFLLCSQYGPPLYNKGTWLLMPHAEMDTTPSGWLKL